VASRWIAGGRIDAARLARRRLGWIDTAELAKRRIASGRVDAS
jgi:hypothetical protein